MFPEFVINSTLFRQEFPPAVSFHISMAVRGRGGGTYICLKTSSIHWISWLSGLSRAIARHWAVVFEPRYRIILFRRFFGNGGNRTTPRNTSCFSSGVSRILSRSLSSTMKKWAGLNSSSAITCLYRTSSRNRLSGRAKMSTMLL